MDNLGERLKQIRTENHLTQSNFAHELEISQTHVSKIEKGIEKPSETLLKFVSYRFAVDMHWLKTGEGDSALNKSSDVEGIIGSYYIERKKFEDKFRCLNNDSLWEYVQAISSFMRCLTADFTIYQEREQCEYFSYFQRIAQLLFIITLTIRDDNLTIKERGTKVERLSEKLIDTISKLI